MNDDDKYWQGVARQSGKREAGRTEAAAVNAKEDKTAVTKAVKKWEGKTREIAKSVKAGADPEAANKATRELGKKPKKEDEGVQGQGRKRAMTQSM